MEIKFYFLNFFSLLFLVSSCTTQPPVQTETEKDLEKIETSPSTKNLDESSGVQQSFILNGEGLRLYKNNQSFLAIQKFKKAIQHNPDVPSFYYNLGNALFVVEDFSNASKYYELATIKNKNYIDAFYQKGITLYYLKKYDEALTVYDELIQLDPKYYDAYINRAAIYGKLGELEKAIKANTLAIHLEPNDYLPYLNRGYDYRDLGQITKACRDWKKACELGKKKACREIQTNCIGISE